MTRADRMQPVQKIVDADERKRAERLAATEGRVAQCERKLEELKQYHSDYQRAYQDRVAAGISSVGLRDYQHFLARLAEAVRQQTQVVQSARLERDTERKHWQEAARRAKAIEHVVDQWQADDRREAGKREQRDSDERAQLSRTAKLD